MTLTASLGSERRGELYSCCLRALRVDGGWNQHRVHGWEWELEKKCQDTEHVANVEGVGRQEISLLHRLCLMVDTVTSFDACPSAFCVLRLLPTTGRLPLKAV